MEQGKITEEEYTKWRKGKVMYGKRFTDVTGAENNSRRGGDGIMTEALISAQAQTNTDQALERILAGQQPNNTHDTENRNVFGIFL